MNNFFKTAYKKSLCNKCNINNLECSALLDNRALIRSVEVSTLSQEQEFYKNVDLYDFALWFEDHKNYGINWYINKKDATHIYNYELLTFYTVCKKYIKGYNVKSLFTDGLYFNNTNLNYALIILLKSIINIFDKKFFYDYKQYQKYYYLHDPIRATLKKIRVNNRKYKEHKYNA